MVHVASTASIDFDRLEERLKVLAQSNRLELLSILRQPRTLEEIRLTPATTGPGENPDRPISRQAVQRHLDQLQEAGLVRVRKTQREGKRPQHEYGLEHARLFGIVEEFREITRLGSFVKFDPFETVALGTVGEQRWEPGPKVVLVHGVQEGRAYPLRVADLKTKRGWIIGRRAGVEIPLEYDPYVSSENAEILRTPQGYRLLDLRTAKNGTFLNWQRLPSGGEAPLASGDVIGLGRSFLVFRQA